MRTKKSLGQHFLRDSRILQKIEDAASLSLADTVLEVGPGEGTLTALLLLRGGKVIAVEKDDRLVPVLQRRFASEIASGKLELIHADVLTLPATNYLLLTTNYKVVANLPYYITGAFLRKFLQTEHQPVSMTLLLQKEVARRIVAAEGKESLLSISVKAYGMPRYIGTVKAGAFSPPPKVDSAIMTIEEISKQFFANGPVEASPATRPGLVKEREGKFFELLKRGFAHPRKLLSSNLGVLPQMLRSCGVEEKARAENLSLKQWKRLAELNS